MVNAQNKGTGAILLSTSDYNKIPTVNWDTLIKYAPSNKPRIRPFSAINGITMLNTPPIGDQGSLFSCVGWAVGYTALSTLLYPNYNCWNLAERSPNYIYNQIKQLISSNRITTCGGSNIPDGLNLVLTQGDCSLNLMPYNSNDCMVMPNPTQVAKAAQNKIGAFGKMTDTKNVDSIKDYLDLGYPVIIGFNISKSFNQMFYHGIGVWDTIYGISSEAHATCIIGYDNTKGMFKVQNQWGASGGDNGYFWITYNLIRKGCINEAYVMYVTHPPAPMDITPYSNVCTSLQYTVSNLPTGASIQWSSSNPAIATVSSSGLVTKVSDGSIVLTASITSCGSPTPVTIIKNILVGNASGYFTVNSDPAQYALGSYKSITAQIGATGYFTFNTTSNNISNLQWSWDNSYSSSNPLTIGFIAPSAGYTTTTKYVYLDGVTGCGNTRITTTLSIMSMGWSYAIIATPNPTSTNINVSISKVNDTTAAVSNVQTAVTQSYVTTNSTKMSLYDFNSGVLIKQWTYYESTSLNYNLNIAGVPKGYYVLKMERNNKTTNTKILIQSNFYA